MLANHFRGKQTEREKSSIHFVMFHIPHISHQFHGGDNTGDLFPTLHEQCVGSLTSHRVTNIEELRGWAFGSYFLSEKI